MKQTIGRCWRHPQDLIVHVYHILAPNTADEMLSAYANSKLLMMDELVSRKQLATKLASLVYVDDDNDDEDAAANHGQVATSRRSRVATRQLKQPQVDSGVDDVPPTSKNMPTKRQAPPESRQTGKSKKQKLSKKDHDAAISGGQARQWKDGALSMTEEHTEYAIEGLFDCSTDRNWRSQFQSECL